MQSAPTAVEVTATGMEDDPVVFNLKCESALNMTSYSFVVPRCVSRACAVPAAL